MVRKKNVPFLLSADWFGVELFERSCEFKDDSALDKLLK